ncbi:MAG: radical SAM protein [Nanoarchaeota archaeon]
MPFKVTRFYTDLIASQSEPYRTQMTNVVVPPIASKPFKGRFDPYGNASYRHNGDHFIQHKYKPTLLFHLDDRCVSNCQFCYKVNEIRHEDKERVPIEQRVDRALEYLADHPEVNNILFTGGDPAALIKTQKLAEVIKRLIDHDGVRLVRFATKSLAYNPEHLRDEQLLDFFYETNQRKGKQVSVIAQINHPGEMNEHSGETTRKLQQAGVQIRGQPAIIRGVNDSVPTLVDLQQRFLDNKIISYYLTVFMPVREVEQYGIPLHEASANVEESKRHLSGLEKKGVLLASHDFGKLEVCGFYPNHADPKQIVLKWHQAAMERHLPQDLKDRVNTKPGEIMILDYRPDMCCIDHVFEHNGLSHFNSEGKLITSDRGQHQGC